MTFLRRSCWVLTGPFGVLFSPFFALQAWWRRNRSSGVLAVCALATGGAQLYEILAHPVPLGNGAAVDWAYLLAVPGARIVGSLFVGYYFPAHLPLIILNIGGVLAFVLVYSLAAQAKAQRRNLLLLAGGFTVLIVSTIYRTRTILGPMSLAGIGSRYFYPAQLIVLWLLLAACAGGARRARLVAILLGLSLIANFPRFREPALPDLHWAEYAGKIRTGEAVVIPINPDGWKIPLPARRPKFIPPIIGEIQRFPGLVLADRRRL